MPGRQSVARVEVLGMGAQRGNPAQGTGFCIAPGRLLTALHVVAEPTDPPKQLGSIMLVPAPVSGTVVVPDPYEIDFDVEDYDLRLDWIVLRFDPEDIPLEALALEPRVDSIAGRRWSSYGFPKDAGDAGRAIDGTVTSTSVQYPGKNLVALQLTSAQAGFGQEIPGFSGAPVCVDDKVVGYIRSTPVTDAGTSVGGTIYAMPIAALVERLRLGVPSTPLRPVTHTLEQPLVRDPCFDRTKHRHDFATRFDARRTLPTLVAIGGDYSQLHEDLALFCQYRICHDRVRELLVVPPLTWPSPNERIESRLGELREGLTCALISALRPEPGFGKQRADAGSTEALFVELLSEAKRDGAAGLFVRHRIDSPRPSDHELLAVYLAEIWASAPLGLAGVFEFYLPRASFWDRLLRRQTSSVVEKCAMALQAFALPRHGPEFDPILLESPSLEEILDATVQYRQRLPKERVEQIYRDTAGNLAELKSRIREIIDA